MAPSHSAFDYFVNEALWSSQSFDHVRNRNRRNDYGGSFGGPVWIPKIYNGRDKTFFFFNLEQYRENVRVSNQIQTVPTLAFREGTTVLGTAPLTNIRVVADVPGEFVVDRVQASAEFRKEGQSISDFSA